MISNRAETLQFLDGVEKWADQKLHYRQEIAELVELAAPQRQEQVFEEVVFLSKFLWNTYNVLKRIGPQGEGYEPLSAEFKYSLEKTVGLLKNLMNRGPTELKQKFESSFFAMSQESMNNLIRLFHDLSWIKNYSIDTKRTVIRRE